MANINIDLGLFEGDLNVAIVCNSKFEIEHCLRGIKNKYPSILPMTPKRYGRLILDTMRPAAISLHLGECSQRVGYDRPEYYSRAGYVLVNFRDAVIENELQESDASIEEFLGVVQRCVL